MGELRMGEQLSERTIEKLTACWKDMVCRRCRRHIGTKEKFTRRGIEMFHEACAGRIDRRAGVEFAASRNPRTPLPSRTSDAIRKREGARGRIRREQARELITRLRSQFAERDAKRLDQKFAEQMASVLARARRLGVAV